MLASEITTENMVLHFQRSSVYLHCVFGCCCFFWWVGGLSFCFVFVFLSFFGLGGLIYLFFNVGVGS